MDFRFDIAALCAAGAVALWLIYRRDRGRKQALRGAYLDNCRALFENCRIAQSGVEFPTLEGTYAGRRVRLEPLVDHMGVRKIPSLWLKVSVFGDLPVPGIVDFLVRPQNTEFYSPSAGLPTTVRIPPAWPQHAILRTDLEDEVTVLAVLAPHIGIFGDPKFKELVITPRGVRLVYQASQAERAYYMVLRSAEFAEARLPAGLAQRLVEQCLSVHKAVASLNDKDAAVGRNRASGM